MGDVEDLVAALTEYSAELYKDVHNPALLVDAWVKVEIALSKVAGKPKWPDMPVVRRRT